MRIDSIEVYLVRMPLIYPFRTSFGDDDTIESVLVKVSTGDCYGWGEAAPWEAPAYSPEWAGGVYQVVRRFLAPLIINQDISSGEELQEKMSRIKGNQFAKSALDLALWDLLARSRGEPLWKTLGGTRNTVDVGADFGVMDSIEDLLDTVAGAVEAGFKRVKLKFRPGWELDMVRAVRERFPDEVFHVDCNSAYTLEYMPMLTALDSYRLAMIEQPLMHDDLIDHAKLQRELATPICLDESITSPEKARKAIEIKACGWVNIKPGRVGGLTNALRIHDLCQNAGIPCWVGGMLESSVGAHHCLALATLPNFLYPNDIFPSERFYIQDLGTPPVSLSGPSQMSAPGSPGCGAEPDAGMLQRICRERAIIRSGR